MPYASELLGKPVADVDGVRIGHLDDLIATFRGEVPHPVVTAIVVKRSRGNLIVPMSDVVVLVAPAIPLTKLLKDIEPYQPGERDVHLVRDVLDKQIIDTNGVRVVRVNDLELTRVNSDFYVANVDVSGLGLMRRLGMGKVAQRFQRKGGATGTISFDGTPQYSTTPASGGVATISGLTTSNSNDLAFAACLAVDTTCTAASGYTLLDDSNTYDVTSGTFGHSYVGLNGQMIQYKVGVAAGAQSATFGTGTASDSVILGLVAF